MTHRVTLIPGDGIDPEPAESTFRAVIAKGYGTTDGQGGSTGTARVADAIIDRLAAGADAAPAVTA